MVYTPFVSFVYETLFFLRSGSLKNFISVMSSQLYLSGVFCSETMIVLALIFNNLFNSFVYEVKNDDW